MSILQRILGQTPWTPEAIRAQLSKAEDAVSAAREQFAAAQRLHLGSLLEDESATRAARSARAEAEDRLARADALVLKLRELFHEACEAEAERERQAQYRSAQKSARAARDVLRRYPEAAREIVAILKEVAAAETKIMAVNRDLPAGAAPIPLVEFSERGLPQEREVVLSERRELLWVYKNDSEKPLEAEHVDKVISADGLKGTVKITRGSWAEERELDVVRRRRVTQRVRPGQNEYTPAALAAVISLPGYEAGAAPIWSPRGGLLNPDHDPRAILETIEDLEAQGWAQREPVRFAPPEQRRVKFEDIEAALGALHQAAE